jgi:3-oxoadipate CoA-transferase beta subunit
VRVYTDLAVIDVTPNGFVVTDMVPGLGVDELQERTGATLHRV